MNSRLKPWPLRLLQIVLEAIGVEPEPLVLRKSVTRSRRLQKRVAQQASRNPFTPHRRPTRQVDRGFQ